MVMPFNGSSGSGNVTGQVVYANYGRREDFELLAAKHIDLHGKIVLCRYGLQLSRRQGLPGEQRGAAAVLIYSDPQDDGYFRGDVYPTGPLAAGVGRAARFGAIPLQVSRRPGDARRGFNHGPANSKRVPADASGNQPLIPAIPISYHDAEPILRNLKGPSVPQGWQGALPFRYHMGPAGVQAHVVSQQDYQRRIIWDVIGRIKGTELPTSG